MTAIVIYVLFMCLRFLFWFGLVLMCLISSAFWGFVVVWFFFFFSEEAEKLEIESNISVPSLV